MLNVSPAGLFLGLIKIVAQYLLVTLVAVMASMDEQLFGITMPGRPLFTSLFVGLILGDVQQGVIVGAALESMFMGAIMVGAAVPEVYASGVLGCAFAVIAGTGTTTAVALALPVSVFLLYSVINFATRIVAAHLGYDLGTKFLQQSEGNNLMSRMTHAAGVLGMTVIGAMIAAQVSLSTALTFDVGGSEIVLQDLFDSIFPGLLPLLATFACVALYKKGVKTIWIILGIFAICIIGTGLGVFAAA